MVAFNKMFILTFFFLSTNLIVHFAAKTFNLFLFPFLFHLEKPRPLGWVIVMRLCRNSYPRYILSDQNQFRF